MCLGVAVASACAGACAIAREPGHELVRAAIDAHLHLHLHYDVDVDVDVDYETHVH
jgi:hypothetical protein